MSSLWSSSLETERCQNVLDTNLVTKKEYIILLLVYVVSPANEWIGNKQRNNSTSTEKGTSICRQSKKKYQIYLFNPSYHDLSYVYFFIWFSSFL